MSTTDAQAKEVTCPKCKAKKSEPCTYVADQTKWVKIKEESFRNYSSRTYYVSGPNYAKVTINKKGEACKSVHNERRNKAHARYLASLRKETPKQTPTALQSLNAFDQQEYMQLREWLRVNALSIFYKKGNS